MWYLWNRELEDGHNGFGDETGCGVDHGIGTLGRRPAGWRLSCDLYSQLLALDFLPTFSKALIVGSHFGT